MRLALLFTLATFVSVQDLEKKQADDTLVVVLKDGKEQALKNWKFSLGVRPFAPSTVPIKPPDKRKKAEPTGPPFLEFREDNSTTYADGILTLVPLRSVRKLDYDNGKKTVTALVAQADGKDVVLSGTTKYLGVNKLTVEGDADLGKLGSATIKFQAGVPNLAKAVSAFRFPDPQPLPEPTGPASIISAVGKDKVQHKVHDLQALYRVPGGYRLTPTMLFKKTVKIDLPQIVRLRPLPTENKKQPSPAFEVTLADDKQLVLTLIADASPDDNSAAQLVGLLGKVPAGYKLFPLHTIREVTRETSK